MENRHAIRLRNIIAAFWIGFGVPFGCIVLLIEDRNHWIDRYPALAIAALASMIGPLLFMGWLEHKRRKAKDETKPP
jgi:hypothetical protein